MGQEIICEPFAVLRRPGLAVYIAYIAAAWNALENTLAYMFTFLLLGQEESAFEIYHDLFDRDMRYRVFMSAAKHKLDAQLLEEARKLNAEIRRLAKSRNTVLHGSWAISDDKPDSLLLYKPKDIHSIAGQFVKEILAGQGSDPLRGTKPVPDDYIEYKRDDFVDIGKRIIDMNKRAKGLALRILTHISASPPK